MKKNKPDPSGPDGAKLNDPAKLFDKEIEAWIKGIAKAARDNALVYIKQQESPQPGLLAEELLPLPPYQIDMFREEANAIADGIARATYICVSAEYAKRNKAALSKKPTNNHENRNRLAERA